MFGIPLSKLRSAVARATLQNRPSDSPSFRPPKDSRSCVDISEELGLVADLAPIRERGRWREPRHILISGAAKGASHWLRAAAPGVEFHAFDNPDDGVRLVAGADAIIGWFTPEMVARGKDLAWIQTLRAGIEDAVGIQDLANREIVVTNLRRVAAPTIAEHVMAMTLSLARRLHDFHDSQRRREWPIDPATSAGLHTLRGATMLVAGLGGIGMEVARTADAFGMRIIGVRRSKGSPVPFVSYIGSPSELGSLLKSSDVVVNALPLTSETRSLFNADLFARMQRTAIFVNVGRGATVVTEDMTNALIRGQIHAAALDVADPEPLPRNHPLWRLPRVIITPHVAWSSSATHDRTWLVVRENLRRYVAGDRMLSVVSAGQGY